MTALLLINEVFYCEFLNNVLSSFTEPLAIFPISS